jgi:hypothetical protein
MYRSIRQRASEPQGVTRMIWTASQVYGHLVSTRVYNEAATAQLIIDQEPKLCLRPLPEPEKQTSM